MEKQKEHHFCIEDAEKYGIEKAILLYNIDFWLKTNKANKKNKREFGGKEYYWTFNSASSFKELFPYMKVSSISRWLKELEDNGALISGKFNKLGYDKTKWYTTKDYVIEKSVSQNEQSIAQNEQPIPDNKHKIINTDILPPVVVVTTDIIPPKKTLPENRGNSPVARIDSIYGTLFHREYGFYPQVTSLPSRRKVFKELLASYTEIQLAYLLIVYFNWNGMDDNSPKDRDWFKKKTFDVFTFRFNLEKFLAYTKNVSGYGAEFDDSDLLVPIVGKYFLSLSS